MDRASSISGFLCIWFPSSPASLSHTHTKPSCSALCYCSDQLPEASAAYGESVTFNERVDSDGCTLVLAAKTWFMACRANQLVSICQFQLNSSEEKRDFRWTEKIDTGKERKRLAGKSLERNKTSVIVLANWRESGADTIEEIFLSFWDTEWM